MLHTCLLSEGVSELFDIVWHTVRCIPDSPGFHIGRFGWLPQPKVREGEKVPHSTANMCDRYSSGDTFDSDLLLIPKEFLGVDGCFLSYHTCIELLFLASGDDDAEFG